jgi:hypothetical protein
VTVGGEHDDFLLEHGEEVGAALRGWLAECR